MNYLHSPFTAPTPDEIAEADERAEIERSGRATVPAAVFIVLALPFVAAICAYPFFY